MSQEVLSKLVERIESKLYGKHRGYVVDNEDPEKRGRIRAKVPSTFVDTITGWCECCSPYGGTDDAGQYMIPEIGAGVWIEFEGGEISLPIYSGTWWTPEKSPKGIDNSIKPSKKIIKTKKGHIIELEDKDGEEKITIQDKTKQNVITLDSTQNLISVKASRVEIEATTSMTLKSNGQITIQGSLVKIN